MPGRRRPWASMLAVVVGLVVATMLVSAVAPASVPTRAQVQSPGPTWVWPVPAPHQVIHAYDPPAEPWLPGQRGVDLAGRVGEKIFAAGAGVIGFAGKVGSMAVVTVVHADGLRTTYEPVTASVRRGESVAAGQVIGQLVLPGSECAPASCLHWGLLQGSDYLDPMSLLGKVQVVLLPLSPDQDDP